MATCTCAPIRIGNRPVEEDGPRNLREDCPLHGVGTDYYKQYTAEMTAKLREQWRRVAEARKQAAEKKQKGNKP